MKSPFSFIAKPVKGRRYNNTKEIAGLDIITSTSQEDFKFSNREAEVVETPLGYKGPIKVGDILLVHHNVFKYYYDMKGKQRSGKSFFKDDLFFIDEEQYYMYKRDGQWTPVKRYCFVEPVDVEDSYIFKPLSEGVKNGDRITFQPDSEYEFTVDGEKLYRMFDHQITMVL